MKGVIIDKTVELMDSATQARQAINDILSGKKTVGDLSNIISKNGLDIENLLSDRFLRSRALDSIYNGCPKDVLDMVKYLLNLDWCYTHQEQNFLQNLERSMMDRKRRLTEFQYAWLTHILINTLKESCDEFKAL
ncbi:hypothetical protein D3C87_1424870 [compost metagenome]